MQANRELQTDGHVRYWSLADMRCCNAYVCFWPKADVGMAS
jgi:hypothetical protein